MLGRAGEQQGADVLERDGKRKSISIADAETYSGWTVRTAALTRSSHPFPFLSCFLASSSASRVGWSACAPSAVVRALILLSASAMTTASHSLAVWKNAIAWGYTSSGGDGPPGAKMAASAGRTADGGASEVEDMDRDERARPAVTTQSVHNSVGRSVMAEEDERAQGRETRAHLPGQATRETARTYQIESQQPKSYKTGLVSSDRYTEDGAERDAVDQTVGGCWVVWAN